MKAGFSIVYAPDATVYHTHGVSIHNVFKSSRDSAYTLALIKGKRQSIPLVIYDAGLFLSLIPNSIFKNLGYIWRNNYHEHLKIAPLYIMSLLFGWLVGRVKYRLNK